ncbi:MAG: Wzz/FepE/Etk N-terminal domain-containing protein [Desulfosarcinaceae bacterium]|nr:Wzz/FepE/Etk N-terminal domain-containing protein [Desulfosarcinaceae bacterium]
MQSETFVEEETLSLSDYRDIVVRRKWSLVLPILFVSIVSVVVALILPPVYRSSAIVLVEAQEVPADYVMTTVTSYVEQRVQAITQRILSTSRLLEIINAMELYADIRDRATTEELVEKMRESIRVEPISVDTVDPRTGRPIEATSTVKFSFDGEKPRQVQQVTDTIVTHFLQANLQERQRQTAETSEFLTEEMERVKVQLSEAERKLAGFKEQHINELPEMLQVNLQTINSLETQIERTKDQLRSLQEREGYLQTQLASIPETEDTHQSRLRQLELELVNMKTKFTDEYPDVRKLKQEIEDLKHQRDQSKNGRSSNGDAPDNAAYVTLASQLSSTRSEIKSLQRQISELDARTGTFRQRMEKTPLVEESYNALLIERDNTRGKYEDLLRKVMEANVAHGLEKEQKGERFTLIEPAQYPQRPLKPNRMAIVIIGVVLGVASGIGLCALREFTDTSVRGPDDLMRAGILPVLATIPMIQSRRDKRMAILRKWAVAISVVCAVGLGVAAFHFMVMDLDVFWLKLFRRMTLLSG